MGEQSKLELDELTRTLRGLTRAVEALSHKSEQSAASDEVQYLTLGRSLEQHHQALPADAAQLRHDVLFAVQRVEGVVPSFSGALSAQASRISMIERALGLPSPPSGPPPSGGSASCPPPE